MMRCVGQLVFVVLVFSNIVPFISGQITQYSCATKEECQEYISQSDCVETKCVCSGKTVVSGDGTECLSFAGYGDVCTDSVQCSAWMNAGGSCANNKCICKEGYHYLVGQCWKNVPIDGKCTKDEECYAAFQNMGMICEAEKCACRPEYYRRGDACRRKNGPCQACLLSSDCKCANSDGTCAGLICQCPAEDCTSVSKEKGKRRALKIPPVDGLCEHGRFLNAATGECDLELGAPCSDSAECAAISDASCIDQRVCGCTDIKRFAAKDMRVCSKAALPSATASCTENGVCTTFGSLAFCNTAVTPGKCVCKEGYHFDANFLCAENRLVGDSCLVDGDCVTTSGKNVACANNVCSCVSSSHVVDDGRDCRTNAIKVGEACVENTDCMFEHSVCDSSSKKCRCDDTFYEKDGLCTPGIGSSCTNDSQCKNISNTFCSDSKSCVCTSGFVNSTDISSCLPVVQHGDACVQTDQCDPSLGDLKECKQSFCGCTDGAHYLLGSCFYDRNLGDKCGRRGECVPSGDVPEKYMCQNGVCKCQYGYQQNGIYCE